MLKYPFIPTSYQNRKSVSTVDDSAKEYIADKYFASGYNQADAQIHSGIVPVQSTQLAKPLQPVIHSARLNNVYNYLMSRRTAQHNSNQKTNLTINATPTLTVQESGSLHPSIILLILIFSCMVAGALVGSQLLQICCPGMIQDLSSSLNRDNIRDVNRYDDVGFST